MKRFTFLLPLFFLVLSSKKAWAQTNFRSISYAEALAASKAEGKPVFIDFYTAWCGPCKMMAKNIFPQQAVGEYMNDSFVCIKLDAEKEGTEQAKKFGVNAYPTMIIVGSDEQVIFTKVGANMDPDAFVAELKSGSNPELTPEKMQAKYDAGERSAELVSAYANHIYKSATENMRRRDEAKMAQAQQVVDDYFASLTDAQRLEDENFFVYSYNYCNDPKDPKAQFLLSSRDKFAAERQSAVSETIDKLLTWRMGNCLNGSVEISEADIALLEKAVGDSGLGADGKYTPTFRVLRAQLQGDGVYLTELQKSWKKLCTSDQLNIVSSYASHFKSDDKALLTKANKFLRAQLVELDASGIYYAAMSIMQLEQRINGEPTHN